VDAFLQILRNIGTVRLGAMASVAVGLVAFFIYLTTRLASPGMALLYGGLDASDAGQIIGHLQAQSVPYESRNKGTEIFVPTSQVGTTRLFIAEQGLPGGGTLGYEILDRDEAIGTSSFLQNLNRVRALEGEISRTIMSLSPVKSARVHLVLPRRELFTRDRQDPSASVALRMRGSKRLDRGQVLAVQHLVAAAVPGLQPSRISIVDDRGTLLARLGNNDGDQLQGELTPEEQRVAFESRIGNRLTNLLERTIGFGKVRAEVRADIDFDRIETKQETYDPDGQVVRSTQTIEDSSQSKEGESDAVSVGQNLPDAGQIDGSGGTQNQSNRTEEAVNFEISKTVRRSVRNAGKINRMSVAVLVDGVVAAGENGEETYRPRSPEEMEQIEKLVRSAIGFSDDRGDTIEVVNMRFAAAPTGDEDLANDEIFGFKQNDLLRLAEVVVLATVGILVILLVVRPLISKVFEATAATAEAIAQSTEQQMITDQSASGAALAGPAGGGGMPMAMGGGAMPGGVPGALSGEEDESMINLSNIEGRVKASSLRKIGDIIDKHPEEAVSIMRTWMYQDS
jgi:flagellar M-ring protein FliF